MEAVFVPFSVHDGRFNMDFDEKMLDFTIKTGIPVLRFYGWKPACVSLGRNQNAAHVNEEFCKNSGIGLVRRLTGGRALLHDNELTYSFTCRSGFLENGGSVTLSYKEISGALAAGFQKLGINAEFPEESPKRAASLKFEYCMSLSTGADLSFRGKKLVGSAQFRKEGSILQHGSVLFDYCPEKIKQIFGEEPRQDKIITLKEISSEITCEHLCVALKKAFETKFNLNFTTSKI